MVESEVSITALQFVLRGCARAEAVRNFADGILESSKAQGLDVDSPNYTLLSVGLTDHGENHVSYRTADDIPLVDVPCPCGDPNHWLIRYEEW